jgi:hypothetical protein
VLSDHNRKWCEGMSQLLEVDGASSHTLTSCSVDAAILGERAAGALRGCPAGPGARGGAAPAAVCSRACRRHQSSPPSGFRTLVSPANVPSQAFRNHVFPYADVKVCAVEDGSRFCTAIQRLIYAGKVR